MGMWLTAVVLCIGLMPWPALAGWVTGTRGPITEEWHEVFLTVHALPDPDCACLAVAEARVFDDVGHFAVVQIGRYPGNQLDAVYIRGRWGRLGTANVQTEPLGAALFNLAGTANVALRIGEKNGNLKIYVSRTVDFGTWDTRVFTPEMPWRGARQLHWQVRASDALPLHIEFHHPNVPDDWVFFASGANPFTFVPGAALHDYRVVLDSPDQ